MNVTAIDRNLGDVDWDALKQAKHQFEFYTSKLSAMIFLRLVDDARRKNYTDPEIEERLEMPFGAFELLFADTVYYAEPPVDPGELDRLEHTV